MHVEIHLDHFQDKRRLTEETHIVLFFLNTSTQNVYENTER